MRSEYKLNYATQHEFAKKETPDPKKSKCDVECSWEPLTTHNSQTHECAVNLNFLFCLLRSDHKKLLKSKSRANRVWSFLLLVSAEAALNEPSTFSDKPASGTLN